MVRFGNFARIASLCVGFHPDKLHDYFFHQDFRPSLDFPLEHQIKLVLTSILFNCPKAHSEKHKSKTFPLSAIFSAVDYCLYREG